MHLIYEKWAGAGARNIAQMEENFRRLAPAIIFMDDSEGMMARRSDGDSDAGVEHNKIIAQMLGWMDGWLWSEKWQTPCFYVCTNKPGLMDEAALRSGRGGDLVISVPLLDVRGGSSDR